MVEVKTKHEEIIHEQKEDQEELEIVGQLMARKKEKYSPKLLEAIEDFKNSLREGYLQREGNHFIWGFPKRDRCQTKTISKEEEKNIR